MSLCVFLSPKIKGSTFTSPDEASIFRAAFNSRSGQFLERKAWLSTTTTKGDLLRPSLTFLVMLSPHLISASSSQHEIPCSVRALVKGLTTVVLSSLAWQINTSLIVFFWVIILIILLGFIHSETL